MGWGWGGVSVSVVVAWCSGGVSVSVSVLLPGLAVSVLWLRFGCPQEAGGWGGGGGWERELCVVLLCVRVAGEMFAAAS